MLRRHLGCREDLSFKILWPAFGGDHRGTGGPSQAPPLSDPPSPPCSTSPLPPPSILDWCQTAQQPQTAHLRCCAAQRTHNALPPRSEHTRKPAVPDHPFPPSASLGRSNTSVPTPSTERRAPHPCVEGVARTHLAVYLVPMRLQHFWRVPLLHRQGPCCPLNHYKN